MSQSRYKRVPVKFGGLPRTVLCHGSTPGSALVAIYNYTTLKVGKAPVELDPVDPYADEETLKEGVVRILMQAKALTFSNNQASNQFSVEEVVASLATRLLPPI